MAHEIKDVIEEGLKTVEQKWTKLREEDKKSFDEKVVKIMSDYKADLSAEMQKKAEEMESKNKKEIADITLELEEKFKKAQPRKPVSFKEAVEKGLSDAKDEFLPAVKGGKGAIVEMKAFDYSDFTGYADFVTDFGRPPILNKYEDFHYRNILPRGTMSGEFVTYPKEVATVGGADVWNYGTGGGGANVAKPEIEPKIETYTAQAVWIAGLIKQVPISMLEDIAWMTSFISNKAQRELILAEDLEIQNGTGNLKGLLDTSNSVAYDGTKTVFIEELIDAMTRQLKNNFHTANGVVLTNAVYTDIIINKASTSGEYDLPSVVTVGGDGTLRILGRPVFSNTYLDGTGTSAIVGDWNEAQLLMRSMPRLRFFEQNQDDAEKNVILVRIEERIAMPVFYNNAFVRINDPS